MALTPGRGHEALRRGRWSAAGAEYFLTCCTDQRETGLEEAMTTRAVLAKANELAHAGAWILRTAVIMPNHLHLLATLGAESELKGILRLFKGRTSTVLRTRGLRWQRGYFDHRLRKAEDRWPVFHYIFLNPYRAGLIGAGEKWPGYFCAEEDWAWFEPLTNQGCPFPGWLMQERVYPAMFRPVIPRGVRSRRKAAPTSFRTLWLRAFPSRPASPRLFPRQRWLRRFGPRACSARG